MTPHLRALLKAHSGNGAVMPMLGRAAANLLHSHSCAKDNTPTSSANNLQQDGFSFWQRDCAGTSPPP